MSTPTPEPASVYLRVEVPTEDPAEAVAATSALLARIPGAADVEVEAEGPTRAIDPALITQGFQIATAAFTAVGGLAAAIKAVKDLFQGGDDEKDDPKDDGKERPAAGAALPAGSRVFFEIDGALVPLAQITGDEPATKA